jgi:hypothetical protein
MGTAEGLVPRQTTRCLRYSGLAHKLPMWETEIWDNRS